MNAELMKQYVDSFKGHLKKSVKKKFQDCGFDLAVISDGLCGWVKRSWEQISDEIIINSFKNCHISDVLDDLNISDDDLENSDKENEDEIIDISDDDDTNFNE